MLWVIQVFQSILSHLVVQVFLVNQFIQLSWCAWVSRLFWLLANPAGQVFLKVQVILTILLLQVGYPRKPGCLGAPSYPCGSGSTVVQVLLEVQVSLFILMPTWVSLSGPCYPWAIVYSGAAEAPGAAGCWGFPCHPGAQAHHVLLVLLDILVIRGLSRCLLMFMDARLSRCAWFSWFWPDYPGAPGCTCDHVCLGAPGWPGAAERPGFPGYIGNPGNPGTPCLPSAIGLSWCSWLSQCCWMTRCSWLSWYWPEYIGAPGCAGDPCAPGSPGAAGWPGIPGYHGAPCPPSAIGLFWWSRLSWCCWITWCSWSYWYSWLSWCSMSS